MKMAPRLIDGSNLQKKPKNKLHVQHTFSSNYQKTNLHVQHTVLYFQVAVFLDDYNAGLKD